jgi:hypothetical protein
VSDDADHVPLLRNCDEAKGKESRVVAAAKAAAECAGKARRPSPKGSRAVR